ncbi:MAG: methyltransferase domain-containing protein [Candidatus Aminicenantes bacterium]|nr:MAG: methyltransferase domain-containing protein [Candidatus Aminicenantes bacterium]
MSTLLLMKLFETTPNRYDRGIRLLTGGQLDNFYDRVIVHVKEGDRVLDIGCGTGALTLRAAKKRAIVKAIDINPRMLDVARAKAKKADFSQNIEFVEMGVAELGNEPDQTYDVVLCGLCLSELSKKELDFAVNEVSRILKPKGLFLVIDETRPQRFLRRLLQGFFRSIFKLFVFLFSGTTTRALKNFQDRIEKAGFEVVSFQLNKSQNLLELAARKIGINPDE